MPRSASRTVPRASGLLLGLLASAGSAQPELLAVARERLCVTEGAVELAATPAWWEVNVPKVRAYVSAGAGAGTANIVEARFRYLGPTADERPLGSGELRRQFGLKLRAEDACNLLYVMWRIAPQARLVVSLKRNAGQYSSAACGNRGYRNLRPSRASALPALRAGQEHALRAQLSGARLQVFADRALVWEGSLPEEAQRIDGPIGLRSDNAHLQLQLWAVPAGRMSQTQSCRAGDAEE